MQTTTETVDHVSTESRYGMKTVLFFVLISDSKLMTFPKVCNDLLIAEPSCQGEEELRAAMSYA